jgi:hypothetical protein
MGSGGENFHSCLSKLRGLNRFSSQGGLASALKWNGDKAQKEGAGIQVGKLKKFQVMSVAGDRTRFESETPRYTMGRLGSNVRVMDCFDTVQ